MKQKSLSTHISSFNLGIFTFFLLSETTSCVDSQYEACVPKTCGDQSISYPFRIQGEQEPYCGYPGFELTCQNNHSILQMPENDYTVQEIVYDRQSSRTSVSNLSSECLPPIINISLEVGKFKFASSDIPYLHILSNYSLLLPGDFSDYRISCGAKNEDVWGLALAMSGNNKNLSYALGKCKTQVLAPVELNGYDGIADYMDVLRRGFVLQWKANNCSKCEASGGRCGFDASSYQFLCFCKDRPHRVRCITRSKRNVEVAIGVSAAGIVIAIVLFCCIWRYSSGKSMIFWKKENEIHQNVEAILKNCGALAPKRYSYSCVKKMTNSLKEKLGQGGYGGVYKGKLKNGNPIAVNRGEQRIYRSAKTDRTEPIRHILDGCVMTSGRLRIDFLKSANLADGWRI